jgi:hypothetical protein
MQTRSVGTQPELDAIVLFYPPLSNITYTGRWMTWFILEISFHDVIVTDLYPTLYDYSASVSNLLVAVNPAAHLKSRDYASEDADARWVYVCHLGEACLSCGGNEYQ